MPKTAQNEEKVESPVETPKVKTPETPKAVGLKMKPRPTQAVLGGEVKDAVSLKQTKILQQPVFPLADGAIAFESVTGPAAITDVCLKLVEYTSVEKLSMGQKILGVSAEAIGYHLQMDLNDKVMLDEDGNPLIDTEKNPTPVVIGKYTVQWNIPAIGSRSGRSGVTKLNLVPGIGIPMASRETGRVDAKGLPIMTRPYEVTEKTSQVRDAIESVIISVANSGDPALLEIYDAIPTSNAALEAEANGGKVGLAGRMDAIAKGDLPMISNTEVEDDEEPEVNS